MGNEWRICSAKHARCRSAALGKEWKLDTACYTSNLVGNVAHDSNAVNAIFTIQNKKDTYPLPLNTA